MELQNIQMTELAVSTMKLTKSDRMVDKQPFSPVLHQFGYAKFGWPNILPVIKFWAFRSVKLYSNS